MSTDNIITIIFSSLTILVNIALWVVALVNLQKLNKRDTFSHQRNLSETVFKIVQSHQNIYLTLIGNIDYLNMMYSIPNTNEKEEVGNVLGTVVINHCWNIFIYAKNKLLDYDTLLGMENDISEIFALPLISWRWNNVKKFYSEDFQNFICDISEKGRRPKL